MKTFLHALIIVNDVGNNKRNYYGLVYQRVNHKTESCKYMNRIADKFGCYNKEVLQLSSHNFDTWNDWKINISECVKINSNYKQNSNGVIKVLHLLHF